MQLNEVIDNLTVWIQLNLCDDMKLLKPSDGKMSSEYELVTPTAFPLYVPPKDQLPPDITQQIPSICLQLKEGSDDMVKGTRSLDIRLAFSTYRPGRFKEVEDAEGNTLVEFTRDAEGWKELWLWVSKSVHKIQSEMYIEGVKVDRSTPVKYGHFQIDENIVEAYPMWYAWVTFTVTCGLSLKNNSYKENL